MNQNAQDDDRAVIAQLMEMDDAELQTWLLANGQPCQRCGGSIARAAKRWFHISIDGAFRYCRAAVRGVDMRAPTKGVPGHWQATPPQDVAWDQAVADARGVQA